MLPIGIRHSVVTNQDVEKLHNHWKFEDERFLLRNVSGFHEASFTHSMPEEIIGLVRGDPIVRVVYKNERDLGDLFFSDAFDGLTIEIEQRESRSHTQDLALCSLIEVLIGRNITTYLTSPDVFIDSANRKVYYSLQYSDVDLKHAVAQIFPDSSPYLDGADLVELHLDGDLGRWNLRIISTMPGTLEVKFPKSTIVPTEIGILQRQERRLDDSEFKGLSTFLPGNDFCTI